MMSLLSSLELAGKKGPLDLLCSRLLLIPRGCVRTNKYLQKSSVTRVCAVGGFFVSIPVFLTGIILYTFIQFHSTPAIITSVFIGLGIIFCGCAMVHNVFVWQRVIYEGIMLPRILNDPPPPHRPLQRLDPVSLSDVVSWLMLKHMLTATTPGPRAQPVVDLGLSGPRHHLHHNHLHNSSISSATAATTPLTRHSNATLSPQQQLNISLQSQRLNHSHALSTLSTSKHSLGGNSSSVSPGAGVSLSHQPALSFIPPPQIVSPVPKLANGGLHIARRVPAAATQVTRVSPGRERTSSTSGSAGVREMLTSLGLLCLVSLLLALLALIFLLKISPAAEVSPAASSRGPSEQTIVSFEEYVVVYEVTLALCALTLSLNLCCLLVCAIQFLFAVKLARAAQGGESMAAAAAASAATPDHRLHLSLQRQDTPASPSSAGMPNATLDLSALMNSHELSTLV
ncbi:hypothetical protein B566_EDAN008653 [Ephemera danica]|nr:hypothetical protein B566_EDAN008653 [Ephemera danica]